MRRFIQRRKHVLRYRNALRLYRYLQNPSIWKRNNPNLTNGMMIVRRRSGTLLIVPTHAISNRAVMETLQ